MTHINTSTELTITIQQPIESNIKLMNLPILFDDLQLSTLDDTHTNLIAQIDAVLPQTQCGLCNHPEGCLPYAYAITLKQEAHNKCIPGGQAVTDSISYILMSHKPNEHSLSTHTSKNRPLNKPEVDTPAPLIALPSKWPTDNKTNRPQEFRAVIREDDCIGCTKCIPACPVDAIVGTGKHMHTIFTDLCTGCELCIPPCPVDCIDLVPITRLLDSEAREKEEQDLRSRYHTHLDRVHSQLQDKHNSRPVTSVVESKLSNLTSMASDHIDISETQAKYAIASAKLRSKIKKLEKQLEVRHNDKKHAELSDLQEALAELG